MKYKIDFEGLKTYLQGLKSDDFRRYEDVKREGLSTYKIIYPRIKIKPATSIRDIDFFKMDKSKIALDEVIQIGMPFLLDAVGNDLTICELSNRKYKLPTGRVIDAKYIETIIFDCKQRYSTIISGYWMIPPQYIAYN